MIFPPSSAPLYIRLLTVGQPHCVEAQSGGGHWPGLESILPKQSKEHRSLLDTLKGSSRQASKGETVRRQSWGVLVKGDGEEV